MRTLLASTLTGSGFDVEACRSGSEALAAFHRFDPDVLVADIDLGQRPNGVELATILRAQAPYLGLVFITNYPSIRAFERTISPPAKFALLQKDMIDSTQRIVDVIESALSDVVEPKVDAATLMDSPLFQLTDVQLETVRLMAAGLTNAEIAERRASSLRAVERLIGRIFEVLQVNDDPSHNPRVLVTNMYTKTYGYPNLDEVT